MSKIYWSKNIRFLLSIDKKVVILGLVSLVLIILISLDFDWFERYVDKTPARIILNLSYSITAAVIFYIIVNHIPYFNKWIIYNEIIVDRLERIRYESIMLSHEVVHDFFNNKEQVNKIIKYLNAIDSPNQRTIESPTGTLIINKQVEIEEHYMLPFLKLKNIIEDETTEILKLDKYISSETLKDIETIKSSQFISILNYSHCNNGKYIISQNDLEHLANSVFYICHRIQNIDIYKMRYSNK